MEVGERIRDFRKKKKLNQRDFAQKLGYSYGYIADLERGRQKPSREFLERIKEQFGTSSDYILYGDPFYLWAEKIEEFTETLQQANLPKEISQKLSREAFDAMIILKENIKVSEPKPEYQVLPTSTKKLLDNVKEILESGNDTMIEALKHNIKAFLEAIRITKNQNEDKGGG
jgi:transcriptional regulator with XRE-family HTH domain